MGRFCPGRLALLLAGLLGLAAIGCATATGGFGGLSLDGEVFYDLADSGAPTVPRPSVRPGSPASAPRAERALAADTVQLDSRFANLAAATNAAASAPASVLLPRLRIYSASLALVVDNVAAGKSRIIGIAEGAGGYVESASGATVVVRVPAADFNPLLSEIERGGRVAGRSVRTRDVTARVADLQSRLRVARQTRERLAALLQRTEDAEERVRILAELRRLIESIDQMESSLSSLQGQVAMSRIAVQLISRIDQDAVSRQRIPFGWLARLDPLRTTLATAVGWGLPVEQEFAIFAGDGFSAESAEGTRLRIGAVNNDPRGDASYWQRALEYHLGPLYDSAHPIVGGNFRGVLLQSKDREPFFYLIAVTLAAEELIVAEAFYPDASALERRQSAVLAALEAAIRP
jgi:hypothetical protein